MQHIIQTMESLAQIINKLQDVFTMIGSHEKIDLPNIIVLGDPSSEKSTILENIIGKSFLIEDTQAQIIMHMVRYSNKDRELLLNNTAGIENIKEWVEFLHKPKKIYSDFDEVRNEIECRVNYLAGNKECITDRKIVLNIYNQLYDITFIDLPGITKLPNKNPKNIDEQLHKFIISYGKQSNYIILVVVPATMDPSKAESFQIAEKLDPEGTRTITVVTKLDLIDQRNVCTMAELLCGNTISKKLGIIGVVNCSQKDIDKNKSMDTILESEKEFLKANYPDIYMKHGNKALVHTLQSVLITHIKKKYSTLKEELEIMEKKHLNKLLSLGQLFTSDNKVIFLLDLLKDISQSYEDTIIGNYISIEDIIAGGLSIAQIIKQKYLNSINLIDPLQGLSNENIKTLLLNTSLNTSNTKNVNIKGLKMILSRPLNNLLSLSLDCVDLVHNEMINIFNSIDNQCFNILRRFPQLNDDVRKVFNKMLKENVNSIKIFITSYIGTYQNSLDITNVDFIYTKSNKAQKKKDESFKNGSNKEDDEFSENGSNEEYDDESSDDEDLNWLSEEDDQKFEHIINSHKNLVNNYFKFISKIVGDFVSKRIKLDMINGFVKDFDKHLCKKVFQTYLIEKKIDKIFSEENLQEDRKDSEKKLDSVRKALKIMLDIKYFEI